MAKDRGSGGSAGSRSVGSDFRGNRVRRDFDARETAATKPDEEDGDSVLVLVDGREAVEMGEGEWYEADPKTGAILWNRPIEPSVIKELGGYPPD